jgi:hypothetical protein
VGFERAERELPGTRVERLGGEWVGDVDDLSGVDDFAQVEGEPASPVLSAGLVPVRAVGYGLSGRKHTTHRSLICASLAHCRRPACQVRRSHTTKQMMSTAMIRIVVSIG